MIPELIVGWLLATGAVAPAGPVQAAAPAGPLHAAGPLHSAGPLQLAGPLQPGPRFAPTSTISRAGRLAAPPEPDAWFAEDKLKHFLVSFAAASFAGAGARAAGVSHGGSLVVGAASDAALGVWKELRDRATGGDVSARDLFWDAAGVAVGTILEAQTR